MKRSWLMVSALLLVGCGGGGGGGNTGPQQLLSASEVYESFTAMKARAEALTGEDALADAEAMRSYFASRAEFRHHGSNGKGDAWGILSDGTVFIHARGFAEEDGRAIPTRAPNGAGLPAGTQAVIFDGLLIPRSQSLTGRWNGTLRQANYSTSVVPASVDNLAAISGQSVIVFIGHGGEWIDQGGISHSSLMTTDRAESLTALANARARYGLGIGLSDNGLLTLNESFFDRQWNTLARNSLVIFNACHSAVGTLGDIALRKRAGLVVGWSDLVWYPMWDQSISYLIERLAGDSLANPPSSIDPSLPELHARVQQEMEVKQLTTSREARLVFQMHPVTEFGMLRPRIDTVSVNAAQGRVELIGLFDPNITPTVTLTTAGVERQIQTISHDAAKIMFRAPEKDSLVFVSIDGRVSNITEVVISPYRHYSGRVNSSDSRSGTAYWTTEIKDGTFVAEWFINWNDGGQFGTIIGTVDVNGSFVYRGTWNPDFDLVTGNISASHLTASAIKYSTSEPPGESYQLHFSLLRHE